MSKFKVWSSHHQWRLLTILGKGNPAKSWVSYQGPKEDSFGMVLLQKKTYIWGESIISSSHVAKIIEHTLLPSFSMEALSP
jgi:hypothetical protein